MRWLKRQLASITLWTLLIATNGQNQAGASAGKNVPPSAIISYRDKDI